MNTKIIILISLSLIALLSCSKEKNSKSSKISLAFNISPKTITKALETEADISALNINSIIIELYDQNKNMIGSAKHLSSEQISAVMDQSNGLDDQNKVVFNDVPQNAAYAKIYAYQKASQSSPDLYLAINDFQKGFDAVPFHTYQTAVDNPFDEITGLITINKTMASYPSNDKNIIWTIDAKLSAYLARFEIKGALTATTESSSSNDLSKPWAKIDITAIYINNIKDKTSDANPTLIKGNNQTWGTGDWAENHPFTTSGNWSKMFDVNTNQQIHSTTNTPLFTGANATNVAAYHIFPQGVANSTTLVDNAAPHIIIRTLITPDKTIINKEPFYAFITLKKFRIQTSNSYLNQIERGKVYTVNLNSLPKITPLDPDPYPENNSTKLIVDASISDWTEYTLSPDLK